MDEPTASTRGQVGHIAHPHYVADLLVGVACADGKFDLAEANAIAQLIRTAVKAKLDMSIVRGLVKESKARLDSDGVEEVLAAAGRQLGAAGQLEIALAMAVDVAETSYGVGPEERQAMLVCALSGGMTPKDVDRLISRTKRG